MSEKENLISNNKIDENDILTNGLLENLTDYSIFKRKLPYRNDLPIKSIKNWYVQIVPSQNAKISLKKGTYKISNEWICLIGQLQDESKKWIKTSLITSVITPFQVKTTNCIYNLSDPNKLEKYPLKEKIHEIFLKGFPFNWQEILFYKINQNNLKESEDFKIENKDLDEENNLNKNFEIKNFDNSLIRKEVKDLETSINEENLLLKKKSLKKEESLPEKELIKIQTNKKKSSLGFNDLLSNAMKISENNKTESNIKKKSLKGIFKKENLESENSNLNISTSNLTEKSLSINKTKITLNEDTDTEFNINISKRKKIIVSDLEDSNTFMAPPTIKDKDLYIFNNSFKRKSIKIVQKLNNNLEEINKKEENNNLEEIKEKLEENNNLEEEIKEKEKNEKEEENNNLEEINEKEENNKLEEINEKEKNEKEEINEKKEENISFTKKDKKKEMKKIPVRNKQKNKKKKLCFSIKKINK